MIRLTIFLAILLPMTSHSQIGEGNQPEVRVTQKESQSYLDSSRTSQRIDSVQAVLTNIDLLRSIPRGADMLKARHYVESRGFKWNQKSFEIMQRAGLSNTISFSSDSSVEFSIEFDRDKFSSGHMSILLPDSVALSFYIQLKRSLTVRFNKPAIQISKVDQPYRADELLQALKSEKAQLEAEWRLSKTGESLSASVFPVTGNQNSLSVFIEYKNSKSQ